MDTRSPATCTDYRQALSARVDGEDPGLDPAELDRHLAGCPDCQAFVAAATAWRQETTGGATGVAGGATGAAGDERPGLKARILAAIPEGPAPRPRLVIGERAVSAPQLTVAAVIVIAVLVAGFVIGGHLARSRGGQSAASAATGACGAPASSSMDGVTINQVAGSTQCDPAYPGASVLPATKSVDKPRVVLTDTSGRRYDMARATAHRVTLLYFGYTHCPDVCPINMYLTADAIHDMPADLRQDVTVVFITTDPSVDHPAVIRQWLANFTSSVTGVPAFVGLTGPQSVIHVAERQVGMPLSHVVKGGEVVHAGYTLLSVDYTETAPDYARTLTNLVTKGFQSK
jgi:protein SCO1/2